jgi:hypothetical protein
MTKNEKMLLSCCGVAVCKGLSCEECHDIFNIGEPKPDSCPIDWTEPDERLDWVKNVIDMISTKTYRECDDDILMRLLHNE